MVSRSFPRSERLADLLHRELANLVRNCKDPRLSMVTISEVEVASDLGHAKVYFTTMDSGLSFSGDGDDSQEQSVRVLNNASGFFRSQLAKATVLRTVPKLTFVYDYSLAVGNRMDFLLDKIKKGKDGEV